MAQYPIPQFIESEGKIITQFDMYSIDENNAGLLKFDFLGLKNLSIIADTIDLVEKVGLSYGGDAVEEFPLAHPKLIAELKRAGDV